jgi:hypothetical protein
MGGAYQRIVDGVTCTWSSKHFPINERQTYEQVMSSARSTGDFKLEAHDMVQEDIRETFQRAYFSIVSKNFLDTMTRVAKARMLNPRDKDEIVWIVGMRRGIDLPEYRFDQELVMALLDPQPPLDLPIQFAEASSATELITSSMTAEISSARRAPWQFNPNNTATSLSPPAHTPQPQSPEHSMDDIMVPATTLIRWHNPESSGKLDKPGNADKTVAFVLRFECDVCEDGVLLTKKEQKRHAVEHAHSNECVDEACLRRFCLAKRRSKGDVGCQDHLFTV